MVKRATAKEIALLGARLSASEVQGILNGKKLVIDSFQTFFHYPTKATEVTPSEFAELLRSFWKLDRTVEHCLSKLSPAVVPPQKIVLLKPPALHLLFGAPYGALLKAADNLGLHPLPTLLAPVLQHLLSHPHSWTYQRQILYCSPFMEVGGSKLLFTIGKKGLFVETYTEDQLIAPDTYLLLARA